MSNIEKNINLNSIISEMNKKFSESNFTEIEKARYLYIELGKLLRYDIDMQSEFKIKAEDTYYKSIDMDDINTNKYSCRQFAMMYAELLNRAGINSEAITSYVAKENDDMPHKYTVIHLSDGRNIIADLTWDAGRIQNGLATKNFATSADGNCSIISSEELKKIDQKVGYLYKGIDDSGLYMDSFLDMVKEELQSPEKIKEFLTVSYGPNVKFDPSLITRYKFNLISRCFSLENLGIAEGNNFLKELYNRFFTPEERKQINVFILENEGDSYNQIDHTERLTCYIWKREDGECDYYLYEQGKNLKQMEKEELKERLSRKKYSSTKMSSFPSENLGADIFR